MRIKKDREKKREKKIILVIIENISLVLFRPSDADSITIMLSKTLANNGLWYPKSFPNITWFLCPKLVLKVFLSLILVFFFFLAYSYYILIFQSSIQFVLNQTLVYIMCQKSVMLPGNPIKTTSLSFLCVIIPSWIYQVPLSPTQHDISQIIPIPATAIQT